MYNLETVIRGRKYRVTRVASEERIRELICAFYAAWGQPCPATLDDAQASTFAAQLAKTGTYFHAEGEASATVKRATS